MAEFFHARVHTIFLKSRLLDRTRQVQGGTIMTKLGIHRFYYGHKKSKHSFDESFQIVLLPRIYPTEHLFNKSGMWSNLLLFALIKALIAS